MDLNGLVLVNAIRNHILSDFVWLLLYQSFIVTWRDTFHESILLRKYVFNVYL